jgi:hypothetical protein
MVLLLLKIPQNSKFLIREWEGTVKGRIRCWLLVAGSSFLGLDFLAKSQFKCIPRTSWPETGNEQRVTNANELIHFATHPPLPLERLCHNGGNAVIPAKAGIQVLEIVVVSN